MAATSRQEKPSGQSLSWLQVAVQNCGAKPVSRPLPWATQSKVSHSEAGSQIVLALSGGALTLQAEVLQLSRQEGRIAVTYVGESGPLKSALAQRDLELIESEGGATIRLSGRR